jgi:LPXTG-motif cell wall-anchored protein
MIPRFLSSVRSKTTPIARKYGAFGLATAGVIGMAIGGAQSARADAAPYTLVAWQVTAGHQFDADQPFITSLPGAMSLDALDAQLAVQACGQLVQVDLYNDVDSHGTPVSSLWADGVLHPDHDGGFLAYNVLPTPYKLVQEPACVTSSPTPTGSPSSPETPEPTATGTPSSAPSTPATSAPTPSGSPTTSVPTPTRTAVPAVGSSSSGTPTTTAAGTHGPAELAYTGSSSTWPLWVGAGALLIIAGAVVAFAGRRQSKRAVR